MSEQNQKEHNESRRLFLRNAALAGAGLAVAPLLIPQAAEAGGLFSTPSPDDQKKVGDQAAQQVLQKYPEVHDARARHFNQIGQRLVQALPPSDRKTWDFKFHVLDSKEVNAFALPGGNMFMFTGLYKLLSTDDALAGVTGHEMTHVRMQHWAKAEAKRQQRDTLLGIGLSIFHAGRAAQTIAGLADSAIGLKFSRGEEDQADQGGLENMVAAGYNPQGMIQLFQALEKVSGNGGGIGGDFLSDHPLTSDRINHTQQRIAALKSQRNFRPLTPLNYNSLLG
jgi:predicted Zn-dependent protease